MRLPFAALALALLLAAPASALGPGDYDRSFGVDGTALTRLGPLVPSGTSAASARDVNVLPGGRLLVAGWAPGEDGGRAVALARYRPDGRPDRSFGEAGVVVRQLQGATDSAALALAVDDTGAAIVTGRATLEGGAPSLLVARFDGDGELDWARTHQLGTGATPASAGHAVALQPDGRVVVAGSATAGSANAEALVARFQESNGAPDETFAGTGSVVTLSDRGEPGEGCTFGGADATSVIVAESGTIVVGGALARRCGDRDDPIPLLHAYTPAGEPVAGFAAGPLGLTTINALAAGPDETIVAGGHLGDPPGLARYLPDGTPDGPPDDEFFSPDGYGILDPFERGRVTALSQQQSSRIVAAVDVPDLADAVVRLLADGARDTSFTARGLAAADVTAPRALALQGSNIIVAGDHIPLGDFEAPAFALTRLYGGTTTSRLTVGAAGRIKAGALRLKLSCSAGPGCVGVIGGPNLGQVDYAMPGGSRDVAETPVARKARSASTLRVRVTNPPAAPVARAVRLR